MNYFELFEIPVQLKVNKSTLPARYFELSKKYHPDYFARATEEEQEEALEKSALLNKAFKTFQKEEETIRYVLMLKGLLEEEEKYQLPQDFLMEVMEINEGLMDLEEEDNQGNIEAVRTKLKTFQKDIYEPVRTVIENYKEGVTTKEELLQVKEYYYKKKYLERIRAQLNGIQ